MIFRAIFWIGLVAVMMPHEPDLGLGRPASLDTSITREVDAWTKDQVKPNLKSPDHLCHYNGQACILGASLLDTIQSAAVRGLGSVKSEIEQSHRTKSDGN